MKEEKAIIWVFQSNVYDSEMRLKDAIEAEFSKLVRDSKYMEINSETDLYKIKRMQNLMEGYRDPSRYQREITV